MGSPVKNLTTRLWSIMDYLVPELPGASQPDWVSASCSRPRRHYSQTMVFGNLGVVHLLEDGRAPGP
jgi:hypothetical protein